jgi:branched-chain amino acid transport system substrate-binding protein
MRWPAHAVVAVGVTALIAAACSSSHSATDKSPDGSTPSGELKVAVFANVTGAVRSGEQGVPTVLDAWASSVNAAGGIAGRKIKFVTEDTKGDAPTATTKVQAAVKDPAVVAALMFDAGVEGVVSKTITDAGLPVVGGMGYLPSIWGASPNWLALTTSFPAVIDAGMVMAKQLGSHVTSYVVCAEFAGCAAGAPLAQSATTKLGMSYGGTIKIASSGVDYTAQCVSIKDKKVDYVMLGVPSATAMRFIAACQAQGYHGDWGMTDGAIEPKAMTSNDPHVPVNLALSAFPWFSQTPAVTAYRDLMTRRHVSSSVWGDPHSTAAYAAAELLKKTLAEAAPTLPDHVTRRDVIAAYSGVQGETLDGLLPQPTSFAADKPEPLVACYWFATFANGEFAGSDLTHAVCDPPELRG